MIDRLPSLNDVARIVCVLWLGLWLGACQAEPPTLRLATTTSTVDSGLMEAILPLFEAKQQVTVDVVAVGTGEALALGRAGDVDLVLVHARALEEEFVAAGYGISRHDVMYNDFILVGPTSDPAGVSGMTNVTRALARIAETESTFVSRGDQSGTHVREQELWAALGIDPEGEWYHEVGQGMGPTLTIAAELRAYTLSDRGTFLARSAEGLELVSMVEGDSRLLNRYGVIAVNPALHDKVEAELAQLFINWITSEEGQNAIDRFRVNGQQLFYANAQN